MSWRNAFTVTDSAILK